MGINSVQARSTAAPHRPANFKEKYDQKIIIIGTPFEVCRRLLMYIVVDVFALLSFIDRVGISERMSTGGSLSPTRDTRHHKPLRLVLTSVNPWSAKILWILRSKFVPS